MASTALVGRYQRFGDQNVEEYAVTINRNEIAPFDITTRLTRIETVFGNCHYDVLSGSTNKVRIYNYPILAAYTIDDRSVVGVDDLSVSGTYTGTDVAYYTVQISSAAASPDEFKWSINGGSLSSAVAITGSAQTLSLGVQITFAATEGHTLNSTWIITAAPATGTFNVTVVGL